MGETLRKALEELYDATQALTGTVTGRERLDAAVTGARAALAKPSVDLDVELLARALYVVDQGNSILTMDDASGWAADVAAEYAVLRDAQSTPEEERA